MQLNYFSEISVNPFKNVVPDLYNQQIHSLWNGSSIKNIIFNLCQNEPFIKSI